MRLIPISVLLALFAPALVAAQAATKFKHIIIVYQENRTPDNIFGSNPTFEAGVDIRNFGFDSQGHKITFEPVALNGCYDIEHKHSDFEAMLTEGADHENTIAPKRCKLPADPEFKYVDNSAGVVQPYFDIATAYGFANYMFQTNQGPSFPSHQFIFGGTSANSTESSLFAAENMGIHKANAGCIGPKRQTVALIDGYGSETDHQPIYPCLDHPTLSDLLDASHVTWRYYAPAPGSIWTAPDAIQHICQPGMVKGKLTCTGPAWKPKTGNVVPDNPAQVLTDIKNCKLRAMSWVIPTAAESDHAGINEARGPDWVASIVNSVGEKARCSGEAYWNDTAILILWDDWGGWYDHVTPFAVNVQKHASQGKWGDGYTYGFRVPFLMVTAYTPPGAVSSNRYDFGSVLYFIEQNFELGFIGPGDTKYSNYADYQAYAEGRGTISADFVTLHSPRAFVPIHATMSAQDFINAPKSLVPPDDD